MQKKQFIKIVSCSSLALIIPILGQFFVDGWNWKLHDFLFAWVYFNVLGITYTYVTSKIVSLNSRILAGITVVAAFALVWGMLATN